MVNLHISKSDEQIFRWGGMAGLAGSMLFLVVIAVVIFFVGEDPETLVGLIERFDSIRIFRVIENGGYMLSLILWIPFFAALYRALHTNNPAFALFGCIISIVGLTVMITGALPHIAMTPLHDLYYAETTTSADQASLALMWKATWGMFDAILYAGFGLTAVGITLFGIAMMNSPAFGKSSTYLTLGIGILSVVAAIVILVTPDSPTVFLNVFGLITISTRLGWNMLWLSGSQQEI